MVLDTSFIVDVMRERNQRKPGPAHSWLQRIGDSRIYITIFSVCELRFGAELSQKPKREHKTIEDLLDAMTIIHPDDSFPVLYGETAAYLQKEGNTIPLMDLLIGVLTKSAGMPIITKDFVHFDRIPGLVVEQYP